MQIFLLIPWLIAFIGYSWLFTEKCKISLPLVPLTTMCILTLSVYLLGLVGWLEVGCIILLFGGASLCIWMFTQKSKALLRWETLIFILGCTLLYWRYRSNLLISYDDFSHWGMIVKHMLAHHALPNSTAHLITFQSYPPAAACWIYFVCRFLGGSEGMMLAGQAWMVLAGLFSLTAFIGNQNRLLKALGLIAPTLITLSLFQGTSSLMVDNLLAALAVGTCAMLYAYVNQADQRIWPVVIVLTTLTLTKDSGLFFWVTIWVLFAATLICRKSLQKDWKSLLLIGVVPALMRVVWLIHTKVAFPAAGLTKHAVSIENLRKMGSDKSYADLFDLQKLVFIRAFSLHNQALQAIMLLSFICIIAVATRTLSTKQWHFKYELGLIFSSVFFYVIYLFLLWGMYAFTLSLQTAQQLVAFERYNSTYALWVYGVCALYTTAFQFRDSRKWLTVITTVVLSGLLAFPLCIPSWRAGVPRLFQENYFVPIRSEMDTLSKMRPLANDETAIFCLIDDQTDPSYAQYMARFAFQSTSILVKTPQDITEVPPPDVIYATITVPKLMSIMKNTEFVSLQ